MIRLAPDRRGATLLRWGAGAVGWAVLLAAALGISAHFIGTVSTTMTLIASFTPLAVLAGVLAVPTLLAARQWVAAILAVVVAVAGVGSQLPQFIGAGPATQPDRSVTVRLMQANIWLGQADLEALTRTATANDVDVLTVIELTPEAVHRLTETGLTDALPYSVLYPRKGGGGAGIFSRFPLRDGAVLDGFALNNIKAVAEIPELEPLVVYALHPLPPYPEPAWKWAYELRRLRGALAEDPRPLVVGADFNSTYDHRQFRDLLANSAVEGAGPLLDAANFLGKGIIGTYPAGRPYPAVLAIDKVLTRGGTPTDLRRIDLPGSDHHGVVGDIRFDASS